MRAGQRRRETSRDGSLTHLLSSSRDEVATQSRSGEEEGEERWHTCRRPRGRYCRRRRFMARIESVVRCWLAEHLKATSHDKAGLHLCLAVGSQLELLILERRLGRVRRAQLSVIAGIVEDHCDLQFAR